MKKFMLLFAGLVLAISVSATNWTVTVSTQNKIRFVDPKTYEVVGETTEMGRSVTFNVVADTPREAENKALSQCSTACESDYVITQENVSYKGRICNKQTKTVPYKANAEVNQKYSY